MKIRFNKRRLLVIVLILCITWVSVGCKPKINELDISGEFDTLEDLISRSGETVRINATDEDESGVGVNSNFKIAAVKDMDLSLDKSSITVLPEQSFSIEKVSKSEYTLKFDKELQTNSIYNIAINNEDKGIHLSKAFQTRNKFNIKSTLPRNAATYVPVNSGIEITFTQGNVDKIDEFFEITPAVKGRFETHKETVVFVPEKLDYGTVYTVKLKQGIRVKSSSEVIEEDYTFQFQTEMQSTPKDNYHLSFINSFYNFTSKEVPALALYADQYYRDKELDVNLYRYDSEEKFVKDLQQYQQIPFWAARNSQDNLIDKSKLEEALSFKGKIIDLGSPWYKQVLEFPSNIDEGYYLVSIAYEGREYITPMQINDMSVYMMLGKDKSLAWIHDSLTGEPLSGVNVKGNGIVPASSNNEGIIEFEYNNENGTNQYVITLSRKDRLSFVTYINNYYNPYMYQDDLANAREKYWSYIYLDRGKYLPDDTVQIWGVAKPRNGGKLDKLTVQLEKYAYDLYRESTSAVLASQEVNLSPYGTYTTSLKYENFNPGSYFITVRSGEEILERRYLTIEKYTKPAYKIDVITDKKAYFIGEDVHLNMQASFFEGSPVAGLKLNYRGDSWDFFVKSMKGSLTCNSSGEASVKLRPQLSVSDKEPVSWRPLNVYYTGHNASAEEEEVYGYASIQVFPRDIMIDGEGKVEDGKFVVDIGSNKINLEQLNKQGSAEGSLEEYRGATIDVALTGQLLEERWDKKEVGQYYDYINKVTRKKYEYYRVKTVLDEFQINTVKGQATYQLPSKDFSTQRTYYVELTGNDQKNRSVKETIYLYQSFLNPQQLESMEIADSYSYREGEDDFNYKVGEKANIILLKNEEEFEMDSKGRVFYVILKDGMQSFHLAKNTKLNIPFLSEYIPNAYVKMVYFDGSKIHDVGMFNLNYDYSEKELNIKVTPDKGSYKPKEKVRLNIEVRDKDNKPSEAEVNISAVDEAFFAMWNQWVDTPAEIYSSVFGPGLISEYYSYQNNQQSPPFAECGEGGDGAEIRYDFKDNAYFGTVTTDKNGKGSLEFLLPDNLTSWRLTYQGVTKDLKVGSGQENIHAKLPFFVNLIFNDIYLEGDEPGISLRAFGTDLAQGDKVNFKVVLEDQNGEEKIIEKAGLAGTYTNITLQSLKSGDYSVSVSAESGKLKDAVKKDFRVVKNIIETAQTEYFDLSVDDAIDAIHSLEISEENSLTEWVFYNKGISNYVRTLNTLYYSWGQRVDQVLSRKIAGEYLKKYFEEDPISLDEVNLSQYQIVDGGIALFPYDSSSPLLSAMICSAGNEEFDEVDLRAYFYNRIMDEKTPFSDVALCYWGLAALREPVLLDIYERLERKDISLEEKLYYGIALAELGDMQEAKDIYFEVLKKHGKVVKPYVYLESGKDRDENIRFTGLNAIMGIKSNLPGHEQLFKYLIDNGPEETLTNLEKLIYLTSRIPDTKKESSFTYKTKGESKEVIIKGPDRHRLVLSADDYKNIQLSHVKGEMELALNYIGSVKDLANEDNTLVDITRSYKIKGKESNTFTQSDIVSIELKLNFKKGAPEGYYEITDVLPSGLKYVRPYMRQEGFSWGMENGQKITFMVYYSPKETQSEAVKYLARVIAPGQYTADNGFILHGKSQANGFTKQNLITIVSGEE